MKPYADMKPFIKPVIGLAGYGAAFLAAYAALFLHQMFTQAADERTSGGMLAFGEGMLFVGVFGLVALPPTGLALYWLRSARAFWAALAVAALLFALTGVAAAVAVAWHQPGATIAATLGALRLLLSPLQAAATGAFAALAPSRRCRLVFIATMAIESLTGASFFLPLLWQQLR